MFDRLGQIVERVRGYDWWQVAIELLVIWLIVFLIVKLVEGTRAAAALKSVFFLVVVLSLIIRILGVQDTLVRLNFLYSSIVAVAAIALIVIFQPELRRGLTRLGETPLLGRKIAPATETVDAVSRAAAMLSKARFGALMVIERNTPLKELVEGGTTVDGEVSAMLLQTIFFPGTALHDLAVVISKDRVVAAGVQLPLADAADTPDPTLGARHRAAIGMSQETDALVVVVSEETGIISLAERGSLTRNLNEAELQGLLLLKLNKGLVTAVQEEPERVEMEPEAEVAHEEART
ncbi:MAG TPA: diadenylate cyclase CdaA [Phycisphaerales bacterium]|nr:diadenylate cyclase CdaA [Phycisphaerales bacterium]